MAISDRDRDQLRREIEEMVALAVATSPLPQRRRSEPPVDEGLADLVAHGDVLIVSGPKQSRYHRAYFLDEDGAAFYSVGVRKDEVRALLVTAVCTGTGTNLDRSERAVTLRGDFSSRVRGYYGR